MISPTEARVFHAVNGLPNGLYWPLWLPMQLGNLVVGTLVGLAVAWAYGDWWVGRAIVVATSSKLVTEKLVGARWPTTSRSANAPARARSGRDPPRRRRTEFGSQLPVGHVILVAAIATVVAAATPVGWWWVPARLTFLVMFGRVFVGAHNPLDVTAGLGTGLVVGGIVAAFVP